MRVSAVHNESVSEDFAVTMCVSELFEGGEMAVVTIYLSVEKAEAHIAAMQAALATARERIAAKSPKTGAA